MYFNSRGVILVAAIALYACYVPALAQHAAKPGSSTSAAPAAVAPADKFRHPVGDGRLTENYDDRDGWFVSKGFGDPFGQVCPGTSLPFCYHLGENWNFIGRDLGQPVYAVANGEILESGYASTAGGRLPGSLGNYALIKHTLPAPGRYVPEYGWVKKIVSLYAHLGDLKGICGDDSVSCRAGQAVSKGALIGHIGNTGLSALIGGGGLHFEMRLHEEKCVNGPTQTTARASCLEYLKARYPVKYASGGGWVDPTCFIMGLNPPKNDDFAAAVTIKAGTPSKGSNLCATRENGEPNHAGRTIDAHELHAGGRSAWWKFTAPESAKYVVSTIGTKFDTVLGVYTSGTSEQIKDLHRVVKQNDSEHSNLCKSAEFCASKVTFTAVAGTTYYFAVDGASKGTMAAAGGYIHLVVTEAGPNLVVAGQTKTLGPFYEGGPFPSSTLRFSVAASRDKVAYGIYNVPPWLTPSSTFGSATTSPELITFNVNTKAKTLPAGKHSAEIVFASSSDQRPQTRKVSLDIEKLPTLDMSPMEDVIASGGKGGPFEPGSFSYQIKTSTGTLIYSISGVPSWLTASSASGKATTTPKSISFALNANAESLPVGTHRATISVSTMVAGQEPSIRAAAKSHTRRIELKVAHSLQVSPASGLSISGNQGGPFTPSSSDFSLTSTRGNINYEISGVPDWLTVSSPTGTATTTPKLVTFTVNANANALAAGSHNANVIFTNTTDNKGTTSRPINLTVNAPSLQIGPATNIAASGTQGGPFTPSSFSYLLNATTETLNYAISGLPSWLSASSTSGTLTTTPTIITFTVNSSANALAAGSHSASITFSNSTNGQGTTSRGADLTVNGPSSTDYLTDGKGNYLLSATGIKIIGS